MVIGFTGVEDGFGLSLAQIEVWYPGHLDSEDGYWGSARCSDRLFRMAWSQGMASHINHQLL